MKTQRERASIQGDSGISQGFKPARVFYQRYLKKYAIFRSLRDCYDSYLVRGLLYQRVVEKFIRALLWVAKYTIGRGPELPQKDGVFLSTYRLSRVEELGRETSSVGKVIERAGELHKKSVRFYHASGVSPAMSSEQVVLSPELRLYRFKDVILVGTTNFLIKDRRVYVPDFMDSERDMMTIELQGRAAVVARGSKVLFFRGGSEIRRLSRGINLLAQCPGNYAHFLSETLPRLILLDSLDIPRDVPLLVDGWIDEVFFKMLEHYNVHRREIVRVGKWERVFVEDLFHLTETAYVPAEVRSYAETGALPSVPCDNFTFSREALGELRRATLEMLAAKGDEPSVHSGPGESGLLYLQRNRVSTGNQRFLVNSREIERRAKKNGLEIVDPAAFDFLDQVRLFLRARLVVSPIGAAIMNTAFAPKGCRVLCLSPYYKGANYYYFSSLSRILEHDLAYVLGEQVMGDSRKISIIHRNYEIDPDIFEAALVEQLSLIRSTDSSAS